MLTHGSILVSLLWLVEQIPTLPPPGKRPCGRQEFYSDKRFVKALIVMIIRRLYTAYALLNFLEQADPVAQQVRPLLTEHGRFPTRRTWDRNAAAPLNEIFGDSNLESGGFGSGITTEGGSGSGSGSGANPSLPENIRHYRF